MACYYPVVIFPMDGGFGLVFADPEAGAPVFGRSKEEALQRADVELSAAVERNQLSGRQLPPPTPTSRVLRDYQKAMMRGGTLAFAACEGRDTRPSLHYRIAAALAGLEDPS